MEGTGKGCGLFCSLQLPYLSTMSQQFCRRLSLSLYLIIYLNKKYISFRLNRYFNSVEVIKG